jgi:hypothetical protein
MPEYQVTRISSYFGFPLERQARVSGYGMRECADQEGCEGVCVLWGHKLKHHLSSPLGFIFNRRDQVGSAQSNRHVGR